MPRDLSLMRHFASDTKTLRIFSSSFRHISLLKAISIDLAGGVEPECRLTSRASPACVGGISALLLIFPLRSVSFRRFGSCIKFYNHRRAETRHTEEQKSSVAQGGLDYARIKEERSRGGEKCFEVYVASLLLPSAFREYLFRLRR